MKNPSSEEAAHVGRLRITQVPKFLGKLASRAVKGGQVFREGEDVTIQAVPEAISREELANEHPMQLPSDGTGSLFYRHYSVDFEVSDGRRSDEIMNFIKSDPNGISCQALASFKKTKGAPASLEVGDEFFIEITGPWNGPVRVVDVTPTSFNLGTLEGHMEAGQIRFEISDVSGAAHRFEIFSWARSKDAAVDLAYDTLKLAKLAQTEMWTLLCENLVKALNGKQLSKVEIETREAPFRQDPIPVHEIQDEAWMKYRSRLEAIAALKVNFDVQRREDFTVANGWNFDEYHCDLPSEAPGAPTPRGPFETAKLILQNYEFPDPSLIRGIFRPEDPLDHRIMLLQAKFMGISFYFGVRISDLIDETRSTPEGACRVWGYSYSTLEGHFERGRISFEIRKNEECGKVDFKISAFSKPDKIKNVFYRWGFKIFGRSLQLRFAHSSMERLQKFVAERAESPESSAKA